MKIQKLPKLIFKKMTLEENIKYIEETFNQNGNNISLNKKTLEIFPELEKIDFKNCKENDIFEIQKLVNEKYSKLSDLIDIKIKEYSEIWSSYNDQFFELLTSYLEIEIPNNINVINVLVGIPPIYHFNLDTFSFTIGIDDNEIVNTCAREIFRLIWFEKWKKLYPDIPKERYSSPYLCWKYSEMVTCIILNNEPIFDKFKFNISVHDSIYELYDDSGKLAIDKLKSIFFEKISIDKKIDKGYNYVMNHLGQNDNLEYMKTNLDYMDKNYDLKYKCPYCDKKYVVNLKHPNCPNCGSLYDPEYDKKFAEIIKSRTSEYKSIKRKEVVFSIFYILSWVVVFLPFIIPVLFLDLKIKSIEDWNYLLLTVGIMFGIFGILLIISTINWIYKVLIQKNYKYGMKHNMLSELRIDNVIKVNKMFSQECNCDYCNTLMNFSVNKKKCPNCGNYVNNKTDKEYLEAMIDAKIQDKLGLLASFISLFMLSFVITFVSFMFIILSLYI